MKSNKMAFRREFLEQMSTQELDKMLHEELQKETMDDELIRQILDVLESRESDYREEHSPTVIEASKKLESMGYMPNPKRNMPRVLKAASILLVVGLLLFTLPRVAHAENLLELFARWTDSVFEFFDPSKPNDQPAYIFKTQHQGLQEVYDKVAELGVEDPVVPTWIPEGYELAKIAVDEWPEETTLRAYFINEIDNELLFTIVVNRSVPFRISKDERNVEECEIEGIKHYILSNNNESIVTWNFKNIECIIAIDCQEDVYKILKSIYAMEVQ